MREGTYFTVQAFMRNELNLKGNELLVYAVVFGFSQDGESGFEGSYSYIMDAIGATKPTVINSVNALEERGLVRRDVLRKNGVEYFRVSCQPLGFLEKRSAEGDSSDRPEVVDLEAKESKRFAKPSLEEVSAYCRERGNDVDAKTFIDFYEAKGWKIGKNSMKDWKAAVRTWEAKDRKESRGRTTDRRVYDASKWENRRKGGDPELWKR